MPRFIHSIALSSLIALPLAGCGSQSDIAASSDQVVVGDVSEVGQLKKWLELIASSGEGGSSLEGLQESIEKLQIDQARKDDLLKELAVLKKTNDKARIKATASKMAAML
jgi:hypothetical protein